ncbi:MAG: PAS domain-containing protein [Bacteroidales bacterium]
MDATFSQLEEVNFRKLIKDSIKNNTDLINQIRFLKNIISNLNIAIFIHDLKKLRHIWTNRNYYKIIGYTDQEMKQLGLEWAQQNYHPEDIHILKERIDYFLENKGETYSGVYRIKHKEGHWVWVYSSCVVFKRDDEGFPILILGICIDFSDNFKTMKQFRELYKENQQLIDNCQLPN